MDLWARVKMSLAKRNSEAAAQWAAKRRESQERALLQDRSGPTSSRRGPGLSTNAAAVSQRPPPRLFRASTSHEANAAYMDDFRRGMASMYLALEGPSDDGKGKEGEAATCRKKPGQARRPDRPDLASGSSSSSSRITRGSRLSGHYDQRSKRGVVSGFSSLAEELKRSTIGDGAASGWYQGPLDPAGNVSLLRGDCTSHDMEIPITLRKVCIPQLAGQRSKHATRRKTYTPSHRVLYPITTAAAGSQRPKSPLRQCAGRRGRLRLRRSRPV